VELTLPVLEGPSPVDAPPLQPPSGGDPHTPDDEEAAGPVTWVTSHDVLGRRTTARIGSESAYDAELGARVSERYEGEVGVVVDDPAHAWAVGETRYRVTWPEADVVAESRLEVRSDAEAYHVVVHVVAEELGEGGIGRYERRDERVIPRRLA
jgi:hypothetical protein